MLHLENVDRTIPSCSCKHSEANLGVRLRLSWAWRELELRHGVCQLALNWHVKCDCKLLPVYSATDTAKLGAAWSLPHTHRLAECRGLRLLAAKGIETTRLLLLLLRLLPKATEG